MVTWKYDGAAAGHVRLGIGLVQSKYYTVALSRVRSSSMKLSKHYEAHQQTSRFGSRNPQSPATATHSQGPHLPFSGKSTPTAPCRHSRTATHNQTTGMAAHHEANTQVGTATSTPDSLLGMLFKTNNLLHIALFNVCVRAFTGSA